MSEKKAQFPLDDRVMVQEGDGIYRECIAIPGYDRRYYISQTGNVVSFKRGRMTILKSVLTGSFQSTPLCKGRPTCEDE
jgi:hypothetical protein